VTVDATGANFLSHQALLALDALEVDCVRLHTDIGTVARVAQLLDLRRLTVVMGAPPP
jgi:hypothetical protein